MRSRKKPNTKQTDCITLADIRYTMIHDHVPCLPLHRISLSAVQKQSLEICVAFDFNINTKSHCCYKSTGNDLVTSTVNLPEKKFLARRQLTLRRRMESLSRLAVTSSGKGSKLAKRSSSPFSRSLCRLDGLDLAPSTVDCFTLMNIRNEERGYNKKHKRPLRGPKRTNHPE